ncbi:MAG: N-6 DNA methylase, partial [Candidatus Parcubacteria bacterium]|nr:N-6 DNA methylase [Candidatus Parcubacteria bacterium]
IENKILQSIVREYERLERKNSYLADGLRKIFTDFNKNYDSKLFEPDIIDSEKFEIVEYAVAEVIDNLYKTKAGIRYNFDQIPADILGSIYEQYLGNIQREGEAKDSKSKRKSQGIYYTPRYIVDYIVKNTVGEYIKDKSLHDVQKIKILDPACGSGSFLIRAFEELDNYLEKEKNQTQKDDFKDYLRKIQILSENIYGVDLDDEAVELTRLNLLLKTATRKHPLPDLAGNIKNGNSLISGTEAEMKKIYGKNWEDLKPFDWNEQFKDVFKQGGFDVVIGNPPYLKELDNKRIFEPIKKSEYKKYYQGKMDFWYFFLHRAIDVVKENGIIGFITNSYFLKGAGASKLNDRIKNELVMIKAIDLDDIKVFGDVSGKHIIHIYQKRKAEKNDKTLYVKVNKENFVGFIDESLGKKIPYKDIISDSKVSFEYGDKINFNDCIQLGDIYDVSQGVVEANAQISRKSLLELKDTKFKAGEGVFVLSKKELSGLNLNSDEKNVIKKYLNTSDVGKYSINFHNQYLVYSDKEIKYKIKKGELLHLKEHLDKVKKFITSSNKPYGLHRPREQKYFEEPKLICKGMFLHPEFTLDQDKYYMGFSFSVIIQKDKNYSLRYLLGILNSRLGEYWFNINGKKRGIGVDIGVLVFRKFPVLTATKEQQQMIEKLVDKMIKLNQELQKIDPIMDKEKYEKKKKEIEETDGEIDKLVYKLYNLTSEEIKIVDPAVREQLG